MRRKPLILIIIALIHLHLPIYYIAQIIIHHGISINEFIPLISVLFHPVQKILLALIIIFSIVLGVGLFLIKPWAYKLFFGYVGITVLYNGAHFFKFGENDLIPPGYDILVIVGTIVLTAFIINRHIRAPYLDSRLRWWENEDRYIIEDKNIKWEIVEGDEDYYAESTLFDLSEGGGFIESDKIPLSGTIVDLNFTIGNEAINCRGKVVRQFEESSSRYPKGFGVKFTNISNKNKKQIRAYLKLIDKKYLR